MCVSVLVDDICFFLSLYPYVYMYINMFSHFGTSKKAATIYPFSRILVLFRYQRSVHEQHLLHCIVLAS